jgi:hypothetical protein
MLTLTFANDEGYISHHHAPNYGEHAGHGHTFTVSKYAGTTFGMPSFDFKGRGGRVRAAPQDLTGSTFSHGRASARQDVVTVFG